MDIVSVSRFDRFKIKLKTLIKDDVPEDVKEALALAGAHGVDNGYTEYEALFNLAHDMGLICDWCGKLHYDEDHDGLALEHRLGEGSCGCHRDDMVIVKTGFRFVDDAGLGHAGDLYWCRRHDAYSIFGISQYTYIPSVGLSKYHGGLAEGSNGFLKGTSGRVTLNQEDAEYVGENKNEDRRGDDVS